jgi:LacI family transcriptional regulator
LGLARGRSHTVAILIPSLTWPWMGEVMQDIADVVESEGYALLLFTCDRGAESMRQFTTHLSADSFDGLLAIEPEGTLSYIAELHARGLPVVLIDDRGHEPPFPSVGTTNRAGARAAADHLLELGRRRPLIITGAQRFGCVRDRRSGFADGYAGAGWPLDPQLEDDAWSARSSRQLMARKRTDLADERMFGADGPIRAQGSGTPLSVSVFAAGTTRDHR